MLSWTQLSIINKNQFADNSQTSWCKERTVENNNRKPTCCQGDRIWSPKSWRTFWWGKCQSKYMHRSWQPLMKIYCLYLHTHFSTIFSNYFVFNRCNFFTCCLRRRSQWGTWLLSCTMFPQDKNVSILQHQMCGLTLSHCMKCLTRVCIITYIRIQNHEN